MVAFHEEHASGPAVGVRDRSGEPANPAAEPTTWPLKTESCGRICLLASGREDVLCLILPTPTRFRAKEKELSVSQARPSSRRPMSAAAPANPSSRYLPEPGGSESLS